MFGHKKEELDREEFLRKRQVIVDHVNKEKVRSLESREKLFELSMEDKISVIFDLLLFDADYNKVNYLADKYCKKKKKK